MGASASKLGRGSLYDLLEVDSSAEQSELKQAYRKKALELHPDRNFQQEEAATALFAKVQAAYDLLSNADERRSYDQRRLTSNYTSYDGNYTSASTVRSLTDELTRQIDSGGQLDFGAVHAYFEKLKQEEQESAFEQELDTPSAVLAQPFGGANDSWSKAKHFYAGWQNFTTVKTYRWEDIYPNQHQSKQTARKFEQENKKVREASKREFNAAVRRAVLLLQQRDPRKPRQKPSASQSQRAAPGAQTTNLLPPTEAMTELNLDEPKKKVGKAKAKASRKKEGHNHILLCGTCGLEMSGPDLMEHKRITRHP